MCRSNKRRLYERLRPALLGHEAAPSNQSIADELGLTEGAVKMAAHRLRMRYRERLREEIARTVADTVRDRRRDPGPARYSGPVN